ncbi:peptidylprolyl isomerase [bacterium]|nr:peptidylprolyl isomerase [bacterium]
MTKTKWLLIMIPFINSNIFGQSEQLYVKVKTENIRIEPNGTIMGEILSGNEVKVLERSSNWVKVQISGWIWEKSLTPDYTMVEGYQIRASHILVASEEDANKVLDQLRLGKNFEELAQQYSIDNVSGAKGGDLGKFGRGDLRPDLENEIFSLKIGEVSRAIKTELGYHIIKRTE